MANGDVTLTGNDWVQIADSGLTDVSWQNKAGREVYIAATAANTKPSGEPGGWPKYEPGEGFAGDATALFSGVTGAAYLWAYIKGSSTDGTVWRSHA